MRYLYYNIGWRHRFWRELTWEDCKRLKCGYTGEYWGFLGGESKQRGSDEPYA